MHTKQASMLRSIIVQSLHPLTLSPSPTPLASYAGQGRALSPSPTPLASYAGQGWALFPSPTPLASYAYICRPRTGWVRGYSPPSLLTSSQAFTPVGSFLSNSIRYGSSPRCTHTNNGSWANRKHNKKLADQNITSHHIC